jgi:hypothetical protein
VRRSLAPAIGGQRAAFGTDGHHVPRAVTTGRRVVMTRHVVTHRRVPVQGNSYSLTGKPSNAGAHLRALVP